MELSAVLEFLRSTAHLPPDTEIAMILDSTYTRDCLTVWIHNWLRNGWQNSKKQPVANRDLIEPAFELLRVRTGTRFQWVKGHASHPLNNKADEKCTGASAAIAAGLPVPTGPGWPDLEPTAVAPRPVATTAIAPSGVAPASTSEGMLFQI
jgi:ribonuclease HI